MTVVETKPTTQLLAVQHAARLFRLLLPRSANGISVSTTRLSSAFALSTSPAERKVRPQHSGRSPSCARGR